MLNSIRRGLFVGTTLIAAGLSTGAAAFPTIGSYSSDSITVGTCDFEATLIPDSGTAGVKFFSDGVAAAGGSYWESQTKSFDPSIDIPLLRSCGLLNVHDLEQQGADAVSYEAQTDMYLRFKAQETAGGPLFSYDITISDTFLRASATRTQIISAPTADPGPPQTRMSGTVVTLAGSGTDIDGTIASYAWTRTGGTGTAGNAVLSDATAQNPSFTDSSLRPGDSAVTHVFSLNVTDNSGAVSVADSVTITITPPANTTPTANAGPPQTEMSGALVTLAGSGIDTDGTIASYAWTRTGGTGTAGNAVLSDATAQNPSFTDNSLNPGDSAVTHVFSLNVTDNSGAVSVADSVTITITPPANTTPTANAGTDARVASAASVALDGTGSDANDAGQTLTYAWSQTAGPAVVLTGAITARPSFIAPTVPFGTPAQTLTISLVVHDGIASSSAAMVNITVEAEPDTTPPTAPTTENTSVTPNPDGSVTVSGTTESGATGEVTFPDGTTGSGVAAPDGYYSVTSAPSQPDGTITIVAVDGVGNRSAALRIAYVAGPTVEQIQTEIGTLMRARASHLIAAQPNLAGFLSGDAPGAFNVFTTRGNGAFELATSGNQPVWARLQGSWSESGETENSYFFGAAGAHYAINPNALIGAMVEFDRLTQKHRNTTNEGTGYLVGPYFVTKLPDQPLFFEGRYLIGKTKNSVSIDGAAAQAFETDRTLASFRISGQLVYDKLTLTPSLSASRLEDSQAAFIDNAGRTVGSQAIIVEDIALGLDFTTPLAVRSGAFLLTGGISGIWSKTEGTGHAGIAISDYEGQRARIHLGARYTLENGMILSGGASYDGIGADEYESLGLNLGLEMRF